MKRRWTSLLAAVCVLSACEASDTLVPFLVDRDPTEDPIAGATHVDVAARQDGMLVPRGTASTALGTGAFETPTLPFGSGYSLRVTVRDGNIVLGRGTTARFDVRAGNAPEIPPVLVTPLGRFAIAATRTSSTPVAAAASTTAGFVLGNADGSVEAHDFASRRSVSLAPGAAGRRFVPLQGGLLDVTAGRATLHGTETPAADDAALTRHDTDALLVGGSTEACAYLLGGQSAPRSFTRVCLDGSALRITALADMGVDGWGGAGAIVPLNGGGSRIAWVGRTDGSGAQTTLTLIDPDAPASVEQVALDLPPTGAAVATRSAGELLVVGGRSAGGATIADVARIVIQPDQAEPAVRAAPAPEALFEARHGAAMSEISPGIFLVYGGSGASGPVSRAELVDVRDFPGVVAPTGALPTNEPVVAVAGDDGTQLVFGATGVWHYAIPRGFE